MTNDEIKALARQCFDDRRFAALTYETGPYDITEPSPDLIRFARLCIAHGLEMGAAWCETDSFHVSIQKARLHEDGTPYFDHEMLDVGIGAIDSCAATLRDMAAEMRK